MKDWNSYFYSETDVLKNKQQLTDQDALDKYESQRTSSRISEAIEKPIKGNFDYQHLKDTHKQIFQDVYDWAGQERIVDLSKGRSDFVAASNLKNYTNSVFNDLNNENNLKGLDERQFTERFSEYYARINELHPFREGNGRATQVYMTQLAKEAGYRVDFTKIDKETWNQAAENNMYDNNDTNFVKRNYQRDDREFTELLTEAIEPLKVTRQKESPQMHAHQKTDDRFAHLSKDNQEVIKLATEQLKEQGMTQAQIDKTLDRVAESLEKENKRADKTDLEKGAGR